MSEIVLLEGSTFVLWEKYCKVFYSDRREWRLVVLDARGFRFVDTPMPDARYEKLSALSYAARRKE